MRKRRRPARLESSRGPTLPPRRPGIGERLQGIAEAVGVVALAAVAGPPARGGTVLVAHPLAQQMLEQAGVDQSQRAADPLLVDQYLAGILQRIDDGGVVRPGGVDPTSLPEAAGGRAAARPFEHGLDDAADPVGGIGDAAGAALGLQNVDPSVDRGPDPLGAGAVRVGIRIRHRDDGRAGVERARRQRPAIGRLTRAGQIVARERPLARARTGPGHVYLVRRNGLASPARIVTILATPGQVAYCHFGRRRLLRATLLLPVWQHGFARA